VDGHDHDDARSIAQLSEQIAALTALVQEWTNPQS